MAGMQIVNPAKNAGGKVGAAHVFARAKLPQRPVAPESMGPDKDAEAKKRKMGAAEIFGRRR
jgi:hypothetical protein